MVHVNLVEHSTFLHLIIFQEDSAASIAISREAPMKTLPGLNPTWNFASKSRNLTS